MSIHNKITDERFNNLVHDVADVIDKAYHGLDQVDRNDLNQKLECLLNDYYNIKVVEYLCVTCEDRGEINDSTPCGRCGVKGCRTMECPKCKGESKDFYE